MAGGTTADVPPSPSPRQPDTAGAGEQKKQPAAPEAPKTSPRLLTPYDIGGQSTFILQSLAPFHSPYEGPNSFLSRRETELSQTYTFFLGARFTRGLQTFEGYLDPEWALGQGISHASGLAAYTNGDVLGQPTVAADPYFAGYFVRWRIALGTGPGTAGEERIGRSENIIPGVVPARRLVIQAGKFAVSDVFDANAYANNPRTQFMNTALTNNAAYDFAQDARGYTKGVALSWVNPAWTFRAGVFMMPESAGSSTLAGDFLHNHGEQIEYDRNVALLRGKKPPATIRVLTYRNLAHMGRYRDALASAGPGMPPDITAVRRVGAVKYGVGISADQGLADGGNTGVFLRWGWNDGATESFASTEADRSISLGGQLSGAHWKRASDRVGVAFLGDGVSSAHRDYLAAGGVGLELGDGKLNYGAERVIETYYAYALNPSATLSIGYQAIENPGYNRDRGPAGVPSMRLHAEF